VAPSPGLTAPAATDTQAGSEARALLNRAPSGYLWNQAYSLLVFGLNFVLSVVIARGLGAAGYGVYSILSSIVSVLLLLFAFGMEDAASVFVPRLLARDGQAGAATLIRRLLVARALIVLGIGALLALGLPLVALPAQEAGLAPAGFAQSVTGYAGLRSLLLGGYLAGSAIVALQGAFFASVLKTRATLIIGGLAQALGVPLTLALLRLGYGVDGIFAAQVVVTWAAAVAFLIVLRPYLTGAGGRVGFEGGQVRSLMVSAWLTNVTNGALGKQMDIMLMSVFAVSYVAIGYYNLAYQIVSIVAVLLISGLGGVSVAAMSVTYTAYGRVRLAAMWRAIIMLQLLLAVPLQIVAFILADQLVETVYGASYAGAAPLLRIFLLFSLAGRVLGGGANQSGLYVMGKQRLVLVTRWGGFIINLLLDIVLIQLAGPAGALIATGFSQLWVNIVEYLVLRRYLPNRYPLALSLRVLAYSTLAAIPVALLAPAGFMGLVARGALFVVVFLAAALVFRLGDPRDIVEIAALNPRIQWLITAISRFSARRVWQNRQAV
jgi:O-antigen/teichoic acid export membrane protein